MQLVDQLVVVYRKALLLLHWSSDGYCDMKFQCTKCKLHIPMEESDWPLRCRCGVRYDSPDDPGKMVEVKSKGLGDTLAKITGKMGVKQCGGCKSRQRTLNKWFPYKND